MSTALSSPELFVNSLIFSQIQTFEEELEISDFFRNARASILDKSLLKVKEIICLGIGKVTECSISKHQLAFIGLIGKHLKAEIFFFDPVLSKFEKQLLEKLDHKVLTENKEGKYLAEHPTLFYLPHCPKQITNNLLYSNWDPEHIQNVFLICNSFKTVIESTPERLLRPNAHYILEVSSLVDEVEIENSFKFTGKCKIYWKWAAFLKILILDIFNDFSIHLFPVEKLQNTELSFWSSRPEPIYPQEDIELITNGSC